MGVKQTCIRYTSMFLCNVYHSFHKRNENYFFTWVSLGIYLLWSVSHSFHKRNENYFSTWVSLGILLLCSVYHIFHIFQPIEKILAMVFNLLKTFWLWFSTCWKNSGYAFQPVEKFMAMLFNLLKKIWLCFSTSEKLYSMNFRYLKSLVQWFSEPEKSKNP